MAGLIRSGPDPVTLQPTLGDSFWKPSSADLCRAATGRPCRPLHDLDSHLDLFLFSFEMQTCWLSGRIRSLVSFLTLLKEKGFLQSHRLSTVINNMIMSWLLHGALAALPILQTKKKG